MLPQTQITKLGIAIAKELEAKNPNVINNIDEYRNYISSLRPPIVQAFLPLAVSPFLSIHAISNKLPKLNEQTTIALLRTLELVLSKSKLDNEKAFVILLEYIVMHFYDKDTRQFNVSLSEEVQQGLLECSAALFSSLSMDILMLVYTEKNATLLSMFLHVCTDITKREKSRKLRICAVECIMKAAYAHDDSDFDDLVLLEQVKSIVSKFMPGIIARLIVMCVEDDNCGQGLIAACVKAWGRLAAILMRQYDQLEPDFEDFANIKPEVKSVEDEKLSLCGNLLMRLATGEDPRVLDELVTTALLLIRHCFHKLPLTISKLVEILIVISQSEVGNTKARANEALVEVNIKIVEGHFVGSMAGNLQSNFYKHLSNVPNVFNDLDGRRQLGSLRLINGYLSWFAWSRKLKNVLFDRMSLHRLMEGLLLVATLEKKVTLLEEYSLHDWETTCDNRTPWKTFKYNDPNLQNQLISTCRALVEPTVVDIVLDYLFETFESRENRSEATILINEILSTPDNVLINEKRVLDVVLLYLDPKHWDLDLVVNEKTPIKDVQANTIQLCLQLEGIGKMALRIGDQFKVMLLRVLYPVLEKAGSNNEMLRAAGLSSMANISKGCRHSSVTELINRNSDYFSYNVINKLRRSEPGVLAVLSVVIKYSSMEVLQSVADIIEGVLMQSCDKFQSGNEVAYLQVFNVFIKAMHRWLDIDCSPEPMSTREEREKVEEEKKRKFEEEWNKPVDYSDGIMEGTAEEMYEEDIRLRKEEQEGHGEGLEEVTKPPPPKHIKLIVDILERSLNFLPGRESHRKVLVLEILGCGVEVLRDYEDELLPIVHKIWSPLVNRFKEENSLIVSLSFSLLSTLGRLSRDFIRMRTIKEVLPDIKRILIKQSKESYLQDRGAAYRYTQDYKMQLNILRGLPRLLYDLEIEAKIGEITPGVQVYLSHKQPIPLQEATLSFYKQILHFDSSLGRQLIEELKQTPNAEWNRNLNILLASST